MAISSVINLFFKGQMEFAILSFSVGEKIYSWLFHAKTRTEAIDICRTHPDIDLIIMDIR